MKISLFFEFQIHNPQPALEQKFLLDCVELGVLADKLGFHCLWAVEHHGLYGYSHSSAPEVFLSFLAARTTDIRLGHGIALTPRQFNHPIRVAERAAMLDNLSNGRVNLGTGKSSSNVEARLFGIDETQLHGEWREALELIPRVWEDGTLLWEGTHYCTPPVRIHPKPVQQPHPPLFAPAGTDAALAAVGDLGLGVLHFSLGCDNSLREKVAQYKDRVRRARPARYQKNSHFCVTVNTCVLPDDDEACRHGYRGARYFRDAFNRYYASREMSTDNVALNCSEVDAGSLAMAKGMRLEEKTQLFAIIGNPAVAIEKVRLFQKAGVDELLLIMQLGTIPLDVVRRSIICFGEQVLPKVR